MKKTLIMFVAVILGLTLVGCKKDKNTTPNPLIPSNLVELDINYNKSYVLGNTLNHGKLDQFYYSSNAMYHIDTFQLFEKDKEYNILKNHPNAKIKKISFDVATYTHSYLKAFNFDTSHEIPDLKLVFTSRLYSNPSSIKSCFSLEQDNEKYKVINIAKLDITKAKKFMQIYENECVLPALYESNVKLQDAIYQTNNYTNYMWHFDFDIPESISKRYEDYDLQVNTYKIEINPYLGFKYIKPSENINVLPQESREYLEWELEKPDGKVSKPLIKDFLDFCYDPVKKQIDVKKAASLNKLGISSTVIFNVKFYVEK